MGQQISSKRLTQIDNSEKIQISADLLRCPVCFEIFFITPLILKCGHSFCNQCLDRLYKTSANILSIECALCRKKFPKKTCVKNFIVGDILSSLEVYDPPDKVYESDIIATQKITVKMLRNKNSELKKKLHLYELKRLKGFVQSSIAVLICCISILCIQNISNMKSFFPSLRF